MTVQGLEDFKVMDQELEDLGAMNQEVEHHGVQTIEASKQVALKSTQPWVLVVDRWLGIHCSWHAAIQWNKMTSLDRSTIDVRGLIEIPRFGIG